MKIVKYSFLLFCIVSLVCVISMTHFLYMPLFDSKENSKLTVAFKEGISAGHFIDVLSLRRKIDCVFCLKLYVRLLPASYHFKAGIYQFDGEITPISLIDKLVTGKILRKKIQITEGKTIEEVVSDLRSHQFIKMQPNPIKHFKAGRLFFDKSLEGAFLADTYSYPAGSHALSILLRSHKALKKALAITWKNRQANLPYKNEYELLIAASIIEKETALLEEKKLVSAVIVNRLNKNMRLQMDPTVIYGLGARYKYPLKRRDLRIKTAYNTYLNKGLPPTPICNVGLTSLLAAADPKAVDYLYFVANKKGSHTFSTHLVDQIKAINNNREQ